MVRSRPETTIPTLLIEDLVAGQVIKGLDEPGRETPPDRY
jgi:hypothetical protein